MALHPWPFLVRSSISSLKWSRFERSPLPLLLGYDHGWPVLGLISSPSRAVQLRSAAVMSRRSREGFRGLLLASFEASWAARCGSWGLFPLLLLMFLLAVPVSPARLRFWAVVGMSKKKPASDTSRRVFGGDFWWDGGGMCRYPQRASTKVGGGIAQQKL